MNFTSIEISTSKTKMSTPMYYNFTSSSTGEHNNKRPLRSQQDMNQIDQHRQAAISPAASFATSSSNSSSSLNSQFNSLTPNSAASSTTAYSSSSSSSSASSTASSTNLLVNSANNVINRIQPPTTTNTTTVAGLRSPASYTRDLLRQTSMTPIQSRHHHSPSQLTHSYTLHSLEPKPLKPFKSHCAYIDAMKEDLAEWLNSIYSDLELTPEGFFSQLETGAIICRHANNVTQMGRKMMMEQIAADATSAGSDNENNNSINDSSITSQQNSLSSPSPDQDDYQHNQHGHLTSLNFSGTNGKFARRHRHSTTNSSISSISTTTSSSTGRHRLSLTGSTCAPVGSSSRSSDKIIDWFRVKVIPYKSDARPGTFFARDNICQFILWCRSLNILECLLFETDDLVARKNEKSFILCMLEVARIGFKVGMPTPLIIQLEQEIDREIENDAKLQQQKLEVEAERVTKEDDNLLRTDCSVTGPSANEVSSNDSNNDKNNNSNNGNDDELAHVMRQQLELKTDDDDDCSDSLLRASGSSPELDSKQHESSDSGAPTPSAETKEEDEYCSEDFGPKPQVITNDLLSLHERVVQLLCQCTCPTQFPMVRIGDGKYKVGDKLIIFVRILRRHIMVRVGGGWQELSEFLRQKDPCRTATKHGQSYLTQQQQHSTSGGRNTLNSLSPGPIAIPATDSPGSPAAGTTNFCSIPVYRSRLAGSSHHLNSTGKNYKAHKSGGAGCTGHRLISGSASMSWLSHN